MKRKHILIASVALMATSFLESCSDEFLQDKKNYDYASPQDAYNNYSGALARVNDIYKFIMPDVKGAPSFQYNSTGDSDAQSQSTEEYSGFGAFVDPRTPLTYQTGNNPVPDYFHGSSGNIQTMTYGIIRNCNDAIEGIEGSTLSQEQKNELLGQLYFLRAWRYYNLLKWYGGVPIVDKVQEVTAESVTPRSTTKACIDFICNDLKKSSELLAPFTQNGGWTGKDLGRVTSGTAEALLGRVRLLYASPLFNRSNDVNRWQQAYDDIKASIAVLEKCGNGLQNFEAPGNNAAGWAKLFSEVEGNKEAVMITLYNTTASTSAADYSKNNPWERGIRPKNTLGNGGKNPSGMMVDLFPMADGKRPATYGSYTKLETSEYTYDTNPESPTCTPVFMNRDPRFYRTFAFPGVHWHFKGDPRNDKNNNPYDGSSYELWNYVWYTSEKDRDDIESGNTYGADNLLDNVKGLYIRKRSDDLQVSSNPRYQYSQENGFTYNANPYIEIRYAEVLLNYAEAACGLAYAKGGDNALLKEAVDRLKLIRQRVGYTGDCGLQANLESDPAACMSAILYERQIELAYEGNRFDDCRRWLLYDGDGMGGGLYTDDLPASWKLTGWNGNTCNWLGVVPLNGQRRDNIEYRVRNDYNNGLGGNSWPVGDASKNPDPLKDIKRPKALDLNEDISTSQETLKEFYDTYLIRKKKKGDSYDSNKGEYKITFYPRYYFLGLNQGAQGANSAVQQTIGWGDYNNGGANGTFDPLAE